MSFKAISNYQIIHEFKNSKIGLFGIAILLYLICISIYAILTIPLDSYRQWNNPNYWINYPKAAMPAWINIFSSLKQPEHLMMDKPIISHQVEDGTLTVKNTYKFLFNYDFFPSDFMLNYAVQYGVIPPIVSIQLTRPDGYTFDLVSKSLPSAEGNMSSFYDTIYSTQEDIKHNLRSYLHKFSYDVDDSRPEQMLFSSQSGPRVLKGQYMLTQSFTFFNGEDHVLNSQLIVGGKVYGLLGTDELRRDLSIGLLWGTPIALLIGLSVSILSILIGSVYGVMAAYKGKRIEQGMMMIVQFFVSIPTIPILIIFSVSIGQSIFLIIGFLIIFSSVGQALVSRSMGLQIKNFQYVEASKLLGERDTKIVFRHILPQLVPYLFANIALSVPGAILGEAGLSFFGLGDPTIPTWGQIFHDAQTFSATARGLWWWILPPGIMIGITGLAFVLIGYTLESIVNPQKKGN